MNAKQESERLMNHMLPLAEKMLRQYGEFYPYGGYMKLDGMIVDVGAEDPDTDHPKSRDMIYVLRSSFQEMASARQCKAVAIVFDVAVTLPESDRKSDAIQVCIEHVDGYSAEVFFPYEIVNKEIAYGKTFAQQGKYEIFGGS
ncbi:MAG TPA: hypothetical protein VGJ51_14765 [Candidatus Angelobacter sp.]